MKTIWNLVTILSIAAYLIKHAHGFVMPRFIVIILMVPLPGCLWSTQGLYSLKRHRLTGIWIPIMNLRRSDDRLRFIVRIPIPINGAFLENLENRGPGGTWVKSSRTKHNKARTISYIYMIYIYIYIIYIYHDILYICLLITEGISEPMCCENAFEVSTSHTNTTVLNCLSTTVKSH